MYRVLLPSIQAARAARAKSTAVATSTRRGGNNPERSSGGRRSGAESFLPALFNADIARDPFRAVDSIIQDAFQIASPMMPSLARSMLAPFGMPGVGGQGLRGLETEMKNALERTVGRTAIALDIAEFENRYEIHAELPGVDKSSLRVDVDEDTWPHTLTITAQKTVSAGDESTQSGKGGSPVVDVKADEQAESKDKSSSSSSEEEPESVQSASSKNPPKKMRSQDKSMQSSKSDQGQGNVQAWHRAERISGTIMRSVSLPEDANITGISAKLAEGVLTISVPRMKMAEDETIPGRRSVQIE